VLYLLATASLREHNLQYPGLPATIRLHRGLYVEWGECLHQDPIRGLRQPALTCLLAVRACTGRQVIAYYIVRLVGYGQDDQKRCCTVPLTPANADWKT
jgi:hypothetical protein